MSAIPTAVTGAVAVAAAVRGTWSPCGLSMVSAVNPFSERSRGNRYWITTLWFIAGSLAGGALLGSGAGVAAWILRPLAHHPAVVLPVAVAGCLVAIAADLEVPGLHLPLHPRQVNELWLDQYRRWIYAAGFGLQVGIGFATYIMTAATYLLVLLAGLAGSPAAGLRAGLLFGFVRGLAVLCSSRARTPDALRLLHRRLSVAEPWSLRAVIAVEAAAALSLGYAALGVRGAAVAAAALLAVSGHRLAGRRSAKRGGGTGSLSLSR
jgi:hypothetical protein